MKTLVVDDKEENRYFLSALLGGSGHGVVAVANGVEALQALEAGGIDLVISDILMPAMDGFELCRRMRKVPALGQVPLIFYTATYTGPKDEEFAYRVGADGFIVKPCEPDAILAAIARVTSGARRKAPEAAPAPEAEVLKLYNERLIRKLEQKMQELDVLNTRLTLALGASNIGLWEMTPQTEEVWFSPEWKRQVGCEDTEVPNQLEELHVRLHPEDRPAVLKGIEDCSTGRRPDYQAEFRLRHKDGSWRWIVATGRLVPGAAAGPRRFMGCHVDITERRLAEEDRIRLREQLFQAHKMESVGRIVGGVAHDFNNLLSVILGYADIVLKAFGKDDVHREPLEQVFQAGVRARELTRQLLTFSRKQTLRVQVLDFGAIVTGFEKLMRRFIGEDIELLLRLSPEPLPVTADNAQLEQVLMNVAINARDAMPDGGTLTIESSEVLLDETKAEFKPGLAPGRYVLVAISDTGCGMDRETQMRIFEPFFTTKGDGKGTGLGLAMSYGIVRQHGGDISVYSEPGRGTTFRIYLPLSSASDQQRTPKAAPGPDPRGSETILLVEDNEQVRHLTRTVLELRGYSVLVARDGATALDHLARHAGPLDLVLTDVIMPGMNGQLLAKKVMERFPRARILYMSGYTDDVIAHRGVLNEGENFISKPFSTRELAVRVRQALDGVDAVRAGQAGS